MNSLDRNKESTLNRKYVAYPEYKDSGVEWLGDVPEHWLLTRVKYVAELTPKKPVVDRTLDCSFIPMEKLKTDSIILDENKKIDAVYDGYTYFADGDILMAKVTPCFENKNIAIATGLTNQIGFGSSEIYTIRAGVSVDNRFLFYRLQEDGFMDLATGAMTGAGGLKRVPSDTVTNYTYASPVLEEQTQIANFLDHETAKIDTLIDKQQQLIKLLKEKRQAVISHAVTKGLNPQAPMKDSGVEWLGEVPEHWEIKKNKYLQDFITSGSRGWAGYYSDEGQLFFRITNLTRDTIEPKLESIKNVQPPLGSEGERSRINNGDLLVSITADLGSVCVADESISGGYVSQHVSLCRPNKSVVNSRWLAYFILSDASKEQLLGAGYGGTKIQLSLEDIRELVVAFPPEVEQTQIASFIDSKLHQFKLLVNKADEQVLLLQERRTALISATVTGKIDVRDWNASKMEAI
ncbi:restriction endonuclease subunit S [Psychromonas antarctica]|uniref:restriction endonuclease subunit S n=1 Tax=Psychromonas antarctica TaxID=67573 RepID=UPI001EE8ACD3|nr:restriction endonuclease subunit S [Psychromonas antarctica]MCG6202367.1 restriction endonuclease subunit S [Psychromonas antarctica]